MATIAVSGASGLVGTALCRSAAGSRILRLRRDAAGAGADQVLWNPQAGTIDAKGLEGCDAVVHLAGENVAGGRWTRARKGRIRDSRVDGTGLLARALAGLHAPPAVLICASAVGFYGDRGDQQLTEASPPGTGFLAETCVEWEQAAEPARKAGIRVVHLRIGMVLARSGGALAKMRLPFLLGLGGPIGSGRQFISWISLPDLVSAIHFCIAHREISGPVNAVTPGAVTNRAFAQALGKALRRPAVLPLPAFAARLLLGEMAGGLLLASQRVSPRCLQDAGFEFAHPDLASALTELMPRVCIA